ncbi:S66 peptidase family protein [Actinomadura hibisca]|uniref:S66 peptidase family protein n=1 Tax=Actinomadura hibisca TaxID=68565 RepID=UPI0008349422|nr:LD-carboxypeptidase [Actinomadura hibisca]
MTGGARPGPAGDGALPYPRLRRGDRVVVAAPSGPVDAARLAAGCAALRGLGLEVELAPHVTDRVALDGSGARPGWQGLAGTDADRAADLTAAWCDPGVRAVLCARGGYGATRLLDHLDWNVLAAAGPGTLLHGSSDITALHAAFGARLGVTTSFGPMIATELTAAGDDDAPTAASFAAALFGPSAPPVTGTGALRPGRAPAVAEGPLTGGTLTLLTALLGTPYAPPPAAGRVVFLEDVAEAPYRIDRMLTQLRQSGWLDGAAGIVLGTWTGCGDPAELAAVFAGRLGPLEAPVLTGVPAGHGPRQLTLELGARVRLDARARTLTQVPTPDHPTDRVPASTLAAAADPRPGGAR